MKFKREFEVGEIHARDQWQIELKSEFFPLPEKEKNVYTQEFFFFIPNALQVNRKTYSRDQFYLDLTNFIRYKTPVFTLNQLLNHSNKLSPISRLEIFLQATPTETVLQSIDDELKLLGNVTRSAIRERVAALIKNHDDKKTQELCFDIDQFRQRLLSLQVDIEKYLTPPHSENFKYVDLFISNSISYYLTGLLEHLRQNSCTKETDDLLCQFILNEHEHRTLYYPEAPDQSDDPLKQESILYQSGLLNKFVLDALLLQTHRHAVDTKYQHLTGAVSAGIAMFVFLNLFVWGEHIFVLHSIEFILITVVFYILKDRIKEGLKAVSAKQMFRWFYDYKTDINSPDGKQKVGDMTESFSFVPESTIPSEIRNIRNRGFHYILEAFKRPERVIYYKKRVELLRVSKYEDMRRNSLNIITRFNVNRFLYKADDPDQVYTMVDPVSKELKHLELPKVYHLNIIIRNTYLDNHLQKKIEIKKFRIILNKKGIKRVEHLSN